MASRAGAVRGHRHGSGYAATASRSVRRAHRPAPHAGPPYEAGQRSDPDRNPGLLARDEPGQCSPGRVPGPAHPVRRERVGRRFGAREAGGRGRGGAHAHQPEHPGTVRGGNREDHERRPQHGWPRVLRRGEPERHPGTVPAGRHGLRHRPHQHPQDIRHATRRGRPGGRAGGGHRGARAVPPRAIGGAGRGDGGVPPLRGPRRFDRADAWLPRELRRPRPRIRLRVPARERRPPGGGGACGPERELPSRAGEGGVPPGLLGPADARVRGHCQTAP